MSQLKLYLVLALASWCGFAREPEPLTADQIVSRMVEADKSRLADMRNYGATRRYVLENQRFHKRAEMVVRMTWTNPGSKEFVVISEQGSSIIRKRVLQAMIDAELESAQRHEASRIIPANYSFRLLGTEATDGRFSYVLEIGPRTENKFLLRGRIWIDAADFAIIRVEGGPAKNPSFWTRNVRVVQRYEKVGQFWLPRSNASRADARIFGRTEVTIDYFNYHITSSSERTMAEAR